MIITATIETSIWSDHSPVNCKIRTFGKKETQKIFDLEQIYFAKKRKTQHIQNYFAGNQHSGVTTPILWNTSKAVVRSHFISLFARLKKEN